MGTLCGSLKYSSDEIRVRWSSTGRSASSNGSSKNEGSCGPGGSRLYWIGWCVSEGLRQPRTKAHVEHVQIPEDTCM